MTADPPADRAPGAPGGETERVQAALDFALEWPDLGLRGRLQAILNDEYDPAADPAYRPICGIVATSGPNGEPLACGYRRNHEGAHSWATLPTFTHPPAPPSADAGGFEAWARGNEDVIYESDYQLARRAWNAATRAAQQQHASETAAYDSEILRLQDQEAHFARKAHSYEIANMGLDQRVERLTADLQAAQQRAGALEHAMRDALANLGRNWHPFTAADILRAALATPPTPTGDPAAMQIEPQTCKVAPEDGELRKATGDPAAADDAGARREVYVLMLESAMTSGTAATIEAVYAVREHAEKHAALINERSAVQRARVCVEPLVMEDRYPMFAAPQEPA